MQSRSKRKSGTFARSAGKKQAQTIDMHTYGRHALEEEEDDLARFWSGSGEVSEMRGSGEVLGMERV